MMEPSSTPAAVAALALRERLGGREAPLLAVLLGSGLGRVADALGDARRIPYLEIPGLPATTVSGHRGELVAGVLEGAPVVLFSGRLHLYEGYGADEVAFPVRLAHALGARTLIVSNAAGGIRRTFRSGDVMVIRDQIDMTLRSPLIGPGRSGEPRSPEMVDAYDPALADLLVSCARDASVPVVEGVYAGVAGPSYETPSEIRMLERIGADAVAMSIIQEVIAARSLGMRVGGMSCIANPAAGTARGSLDHRDVVRTAGSAAEGMALILRGVVKVLAGAVEGGGAD